LLPADETALDSPAYASLCGAHAPVAEIRGRARRYPADVAPFLGLPTQPTAQDWRDAAALVPPGTFVATTYGGVEPPNGWRVVQPLEVVQMVQERVTGADCAEAIALGAADVPDMLELVAQTEPGPFLSRTFELGDYLGIRRDGVLVAMAGERFHPSGWTEISAVCTSPGHRGEGLASRLVGALIARIHGRSERAFLHVLTTNTSAIRLYAALGFRTRRQGTFVVMTRDDEAL
jgi:ribosomal protein S18 acetylase RimI-like enzyme